jgi:hypothetical protein
VGKPAYKTHGLAIILLASRSKISGFFGDHLFRGPRRDATLFFEPIPGGDHLASEQRETRILTPASTILPVDDEGDRRRCRQRWLFAF